MGQLAAVGVVVGVFVGVLVAVLVAVAEGIGVLVVVNVGVAVSTGVFVGVLVDVGVFVGTGVLVAVSTGVLVGVLVGKGVLVAVAICVLVGVGVGGGASTVKLHVAEMPLVCPVAWIVYGGPFGTAPAGMVTVIWKLPPAPAVGAPMVGPPGGLNWMSTVLPTEKPVPWMPVCDPG